MGTARLPRLLVEHNQDRGHESELDGITSGECGLTVDLLTCSPAGLGRAVPAHGYAASVPTSSG